MTAWSAGRIDERKAAVIVEALRDVDPVFADVLAGQAARHAAERTAPQLRAWLGRRVIAADPGGAKLRHARASAGRRVSLTPLADGMAEVAALLPTVQARQLYDTVNAAACEAGAGDVRTADQRRADALVDLVCGRAVPPRIQLQVTVSADTLLGEAAEPGWLAGVGPITADDAVALAGADEAMWRRLLTDPETGTLTDLSETTYRPSRRLDRAVRSRDQVCRFPGCRRPATTTASATDVDHTRPWPRGTTTASNLAVLCRHHHRLKHSPRWRVEHHPDGTLTWTTPGGRTLTTSPWIYTDVPDPDPPPDERP